MKNIFQTENFKKIIPCTSQELSCNHLKTKRHITANKNIDRATQALQKILSTKCKNTKMILSVDEISAFIRFPTDPQNVGVEAARSATTANEYYDESTFGDLSGGQHG